ncbi:MAG: hypothetical protein LLG20_00370 [Acidobacteriales bacterium]|nr:hypothetical protein [Terriglobales bacterium]
MMNSITRLQVAAPQLKRLVAQRKLYSRAKQVLAWQIIVTVVSVVILSFVVLWIPGLKAYAALWGIVAVLLDFAVFAPWQSSLKAKAAGIQELFDCEVLSLPWQEIKAGTPPDIETVTEWSRLPPGTDYETAKVRNWYPAEAGEAPLPIGRLICQRANCWWDAKLRRRYAIWIAAFTGGIFLLTVVIGLVGHVTLDQFLLAGTIPFLPVLVIGIRQFTDQRQASTRLDDLKEHSERLWREALSGQVAEDELSRRSRTLQDEIFEQRRRNPLIFDWVYRRLRDEQEELMNQCASDLLHEARAALRF